MAEEQMMRLTSVRSLLAILMAATPLIQICAYRHTAQELKAISHLGISHKVVNDMNTTALFDKHSIANMAVDVDTLNLQQDAQAAHDALSNQPDHWAGIDANAFSHKYLIGFHMVLTRMPQPMQWSAPPKVKGAKPSKWYQLRIGEDMYYTGQVAKVTRSEIVPKVSAEHVRQSKQLASTSSKSKLAEIQEGAPAQYFAYVRFSRTLAGVRKSGIFRYGGFIYFASELHKEQGLPMEEMNILEKVDAGTMRFKSGYTSFWQLLVQEKGSKASSRLINFPPDTSKELTQRWNEGEKGAQFSVHVPRTITYSWFGKTYDDPAPAADEIICRFESAEAKAKGKPWLGSCSLAAHSEFGIMVIRISLDPGGPLPNAGRPGDADARWWPVTAQDFIQAGARHYTWVQPGEIGNGGFMYHIQFRAGESHFMFFEMLSHLCTKLEGDTAYDKWMQDFVSKPVYPTMQKAVQKKRQPKTLVFVIDMQNDFVGMSFQMPCERKRRALTSQLSQFLKARFEEGATIVASLDYHPKGHCGVTGDCKNADGPFQSYSDMTEDRSYYLGNGTKGRYINRFPPHCEWFVGSDGRSVPAEGAKFYPAVSRVLHDLAGKDNTRVHTVFKGFTRDKDSFSALPTYTNSSGRAAEVSTGGYAVSGGGWEIGDEKTDMYRSWPQACYSPRPPAWCYPTQDQLEHPNKANGFMWRVDSVLRKIQKQSGNFDRIIVTGLVFDFCVKETAFNAQKLFPGKQVIVPIELARPACEGGQVPDFAYPPSGLGTPGIIERTGKEYVARKIMLVSANDIPR